MEEGELPGVENKPSGDGSGALQITWTTLATAQRLSYKCPPEAQEILVNYLPLSYMGAQLLDMWVSISVAGTLYFAQPDALRVSGAPGPSAAVGACEAGGLGGVGGFLLCGELRPGLGCLPCPHPQPAVRLRSSASLGLGFPVCEVRGLEQT